jgi:hypothetical protein
MWKKEGCHKNEMRKQYDEQIILLTSLSTNRLENDSSSRIKQIEAKYEQQNQVNLHEYENFI